MGFLNANTVLGYIDTRLKKSNISAEGAEELKSLATAIICTPAEWVRPLIISEVRTSMIGSKEVLHYCDICHAMVKKGDLYCSKCGSQLKWRNSNEG